MDKKCAQLWQRLSAALKPQISADSFKRWFSTVELIEAKDKSITLTVPNNIYQLWIESNYMPALQNAIITTFGGPRLVKFCAPTAAGAHNCSEDAATAKEALPPPMVDTRTAATVPGSTRGTHSNLSSSGRTTKLRTLPVLPSRRRPRARTIHCSFTAASAWAKPI
jgi:chromosomal replication initiation ATPase DnaA